jgi:hypothetical protein
MGAITLLRPRDETFEKARQSMLRAFAELAKDPTQAERLLAEAQSTMRAMTQLVELWNG